jgi:membrane-bound lytic murein transglycosylase A
MTETPPNEAVAKSGGPGPWRTLALAFAALSLLLAGIVVLQRRELDLRLPPAVEEEEEAPPEPRLVLAPARWEDLAGWAEDDLEGVDEALERSCGVFSKRGPNAAVGEGAWAGAAGDWRALCDAVAGADSAAAVRAALEQTARPWAARNGDREQGLFTGYYEPGLKGRRTPDERFRVPLYRRPPELVEIELGAFREDLRGRRLAGVVQETRLVPFADRAELDEGALAGRGLELVWVDDAVAAFFLHIQGSGRVELEDGSFLRVGYAGQNGHAYTAIGRELVARGVMSVEQVSLQSIRAWLAAHPDEADGLMQVNKSFVFFRELKGEGPIGSQGVALTPRRSLAVDRRFLPLGLPIWLDSTFPADEGAAEPVGAPLRRLLVAQDTGGAIRGPVRGDVFWGHGEEAEQIAGRMRQEGRWWLLLPVGVEPPAEMVE